MKRDSPESLELGSFSSGQRPARGLFARLARARGRALAVALVAVIVTAAALPATRWRALVVAEKAAGLLPALDWSDMASVLAPGSTVPLSRLAHYRNPFMLVTNPHDLPEDQRQGAKLFSQHCARCHGDSAQGAAGPALTGRTLRHGDSDWAMFRTIRSGVPGTAMAAASLGRDDIWRVISHIRTLADPPRTGTAADAPQSPAPAGPPVLDVTGPMLVSAGSDPDGWWLPAGSYDSQRFSTDGQINAGNVSKLRVRWIYQFGTADAQIESVPIVAGRLMVVTLPDGAVIALDAASGTQVWKFTRQAPADARMCFKVNRGVAMLGRRVFVGTVDAHLLALDASTGALVWDRTLADYRQGYSVTSAPLPVGDTVVTGIGCGEYPIRGFLTALDAQTGAPRWRLNTIPEPGQPGHKTWGGDSWRTGGASTWVTGSYDPQLGLLYWGVGNPAPDFDASVRPGDNLYSNSVLAIDASSGKLVWHFQFTPGDDHDFDSGHTPVLIDVPESGATRKLLVEANRNGFFYVLDRANGRFVRAGEFARQTWASGISPSGRPIDRVGMHPTSAGVLAYPNVGGATNWWPASYSPASGLYYVLAHERASIYFSLAGASRPSTGKMFLGGWGQSVASDAGYTAVRAIDPSTAKIRWEHRNLTYNELPRGGLLSTAGGLLFGSDASRLFALDAASGAELWSFDAGGQISAAPISFRVDGHQVVSVAAGQLMIAFELPAR